MNEIDDWIEFQKRSADVFGSAEKALRHINEGGHIFQLKKEDIGDRTWKALHEIARKTGKEPGEVAKEWLMEEAKKTLGHKSENSTHHISTSPATQTTCYVYLMRQVSTGATKIGISKTPRFREQTLCSQEPVMLISTMEFPSRKAAKKAEKKLQQHFKQYHLRGEWFDLPEEVVNSGVEKVHLSIS